MNSSEPPFYQHGPTQKNTLRLLLSAPQQPRRNTPASISNIKQLHPSNMHLLTTVGSSWNSRTDKACSQVKIRCKRLACTRTHADAMYEDLILLLGRRAKRKPRPP